MTRSMLELPSWTLHVQRGPQMETKGLMQGGGCGKWAPMQAAGAKT